MNAEVHARDGVCVCAGVCDGAFAEVVLPLCVQQQLLLRASTAARTGTWVN